MHVQSVVHVHIFEAGRHSIRAEAEHSDLRFGMSAPCCKRSPFFAKQHHMAMSLYQSHVACCGLHMFTHTCLTTQLSSAYAPGNMLCLPSNLGRLKCIRTA